MARFFSGVLLAAALVAPAFGQEETGPDAFGEAIDVRVVNVEAVVTGRGGKRVQGLTARDFRILVDGREVPVDYFTEVVEGEMASFPMEPGEPAAALPSAPGGKVGTNYLVFIDDSFAIAAKRDLVLSRLTRDLGRLGPEDRMAVVAFDGRRIDRLTDWNGDRAALARVFEDARRRPAWGLHRLTLRSSEGGDLNAYPYVASAVAAAAATMRSMAPPAGRKVFLLLSGDWPMLSGESMLSLPMRGVTVNSSEDTESDPFRNAAKLMAERIVPQRAEQVFEPLTDTANLLGYTVYPVDVPGMDSRSSAIDLQVGPLPVDGAPRIGGVGISTGAVAFATQTALPIGRQTAFLTSDWERGSHDSMNFLARETGGKAALNSARLSALERAVEDTRSYYWLGFTPQWKADGRRHDVRVEVRRPGFEVRSREGYVDISPATRVALETESLLLFGGRAETRRLRVVAGEPQKTGFRRMEVPVTVEIPAGALTVMSGENGPEVRAIFSSASVDDSGGGSPIQVVSLRLPVNPAASGETLRHRTTLRLRRQPHRLIFAVSDPLGGEQLWTEVKVEP
jgi:VWFA-related protein